MFLVSVAGGSAKADWSTLEQTGRWAVMAPTAPPIEGTAWLTTPALAWSSFAGRVVVAVFWSAGCEASMVRLRQVAGLRDRFDPTGQRLAVIAVHCPRFPYAESSAVALQALYRDRLAVIAVHDPRYVTWNRYNPGGWPTTYVINHRGRIVGSQAGTAEIDMLSEIVQTELDQQASNDPSAGGRSLLGGRRSDDPDPLPDPDRPTPTRGVAELLYPSGVAIGSSNRFAVADTGNDRCLIGHLEESAGRFIVDRVVGGLATPVDVAWYGHDTLMVSEAGTGQVTGFDLRDRADGNNPDLEGDRSTTAIRFLISDKLVRPAGTVAEPDGGLVVADPGAERLVRIRFGDDGTPRSVPIAGSGVTGRVDGPATKARLAQPVAVARGVDGLVFVDAASSNLRTLTSQGRVASITDGDFYQWGLVDGRAHRARLQRPGGLCVLDDGTVVFTDTGNDRLRRLHRGRIETLGLEGLSRPEAVTRAGTDQVLVADTGNHRLVMTDIVRQTAWPVTIIDQVDTPDSRQTETGLVSSPTA